MDTKHRPQMLAGTASPPDPAAAGAEAAHAYGTVTATIAATSARTGLSRSEIYRLLAAAKLSAVKSGARTLIVWGSVVAYLADLPVARFRTPKSD